MVERYQVEVVMQNRSSDSSSIQAIDRLRTKNSCLRVEREDQRGRKDTNIGSLYFVFGEEAHADKFKADLIDEKLSLSIWIRPYTE